MGIRAKLLAAFLATSLVTGAVAAVGVASMDTMGALLSDTSQRVLPSLQVVRAIDHGLMEVLLQTRNGTLAATLKEGDRLQAAKAKRDEAWETITRQRVTMDGIQLHPEEQQLWELFRTQLEAFRPINDSIWAAVAAGDLQRAADIGATQGEPAVQQLLSTFRRLTEDQARDAAADATESRRTHESARITMMIVAAVAVLAAFVVGLLLTLSITRPLSAITRAAAAIAEGDTEQEITHHGTDELGQLADSFRALIDYLQAVAGAVDCLGRGDLSVTPTPRSSHDRLSLNAAAAVTSLRELLAETDGLIAAVEQGDLSRRGDATRFQGAFGQLVKGLNRVTEAVVAPLSEASSELQRLAARDLTAEMSLERHRGQYATMGQALNTAARQLNEGLSTVSVAVDQVASAAGQIASGSQTVAQGASQQARSLAESNKRLEDLSGMTQATALHAARANELAGVARDASGQGSAAMSQMADAMQRIRASAESTAAIIRDINEISFQTNLLALNAAVEAARAGEAGRGFAVVAEEVRNLAQRSKEAAKRTESLISESVTLAKRGEEVSQDVSGRLTHVVEAVTQVGGLIQDIASQSAEQSRGLQDVARAVGEMDRVVQDNAASSEQLSSAAEELSGQASEMTALVGSFKLARAGASPGAQPVPRPVPVRERRPRLVS